MNRQNRPRNRQPRPQDNSQGRGGRPSRGQNRNTGRPAQGRPYTSVPNINEVIPQAHVSIVLKQDQPTGREVQGIVQEVLTKGNHPRGIKVRLQDGRVGRVQRMAGDQATSPTTSSNSTPAQPAIQTSGGRFTSRYTDFRYDEAPDQPPPRTLADFIPSSGSDSERYYGDGAVESGETFPNPPTVTAKCPICGNFEGDEIAVSRHVDEHLTQS